MFYPFTRNEFLFFDSTPTRRIVVVCADTRIKSNARDDCLGVETLHLCVCIELVEVRYSKSEIGVGKELVFSCRQNLWIAHNDSAWVEVVIECLALAKELWESLGRLYFVSLRDSLIGRDWP